MYQNRRFGIDCGFTLFLPWKKISTDAWNEKSEAYRLFWGMNKTQIQNSKEEVPIFKPPVLLHYWNAADNRGDDHLWAMLSAYSGSILVTGDRLLLENPPKRSSVISPSTRLRDFVSNGGRVR